MNQDKLEIFCVTNKPINYFNHPSYYFCGVGNDNFPSHYLKCDNKINIYHKEKYYAELAFHYWYWKNLNDVSKKNWVGFCQKRRFWIKKKSEDHIITKNNLFEHIILYPEDEWKNFDSIICKPINLSGVKKIKIIKRGFKNLIKNPNILFNKEKHNIRLHFDMHHGYGNLEKAINLLELPYRNEFSEFVDLNTKFNPHVMFISKPKIIDQYFDILFSWLNKCEEVFPFDTLKGYDLHKIFAFLSERFLSYWFQKYTTYYEQPWTFIQYEEEKLNNPKNLRI